MKKEITKDPCRQVVINLFRGQAKFKLLPTPDGKLKQFQMEIADSDKKSVEAILNKVSDILLHLKDSGTDGVEFHKLVAGLQRAALASGDPPGFAEFLLAAMLKPAQAEALIGDLNEHFTRDCEEFGRNRAARLYWARTLRSLGPLLIRVVGKVVKLSIALAAMKRWMGL